MCTRRGTRRATAEHRSCTGIPSRSCTHPGATRTSATSRPWEDRAVRQRAAHNKGGRPPRGTNELQGPTSQRTTDPGLRGEVAEGSRPATSLPGSLALLDRFLRQGGRVGGSTVDPFSEGPIGPVAGGCDQEPPRRGPTTGTQVERFRPGFPQQRFGLRGIHANDQVLSVNPDRHVAAEEEGDAAEHLLLREPRSTCELLPDPRGLRLRIRHRSREVLSAHETWRRLATQFAIAGIFRKNSSLVNWRIMKSATSAREMR